MEEFLRSMGALNDETRVKILKFITINGKSCVCELESSFEMIQSRLSRHLKILKEAGFLEVERIGSYAYYSIAPKTALHDSLLAYINALDIPMPLKQAACAS